MNNLKINVRQKQTSKGVDETIHGKFLLPPILMVVVRSDPLCHYLVSISRQQKGKKRANGFLLKFHARFSSGFVPIVYLCGMVCAATKMVEV